MAKSKNWEALAYSIQAAITQANENWLANELERFAKESTDLAAKDSRQAKRDHAKAAKKVADITPEALEAFANKYGFTKPEELLNAATMILDVLRKFDFENISKAAKAYHLEALDFGGVAFAGVPLTYSSLNLAKGIYTKATKSKKVAK